MAHLLRAWSPWSPADALRWVVVGAIGHLAVAAGWWLAANEERLDDQVLWGSVAVAGLAVAGYADITWLLQGRFAILRRRERLLPAEAPLVEVAVGDHDALVAGPGLGRFHRATCALAAGKGWDRVDRTAAVAAGRAPCGVCRP